jgi:YD repeat-containing protein
MSLGGTPTINGATKGNPGVPGALPTLTVFSFQIPGQEQTNVGSATGKLTLPTNYPSGIYRLIDSSNTEVYRTTKVDGSQAWLSVNPDVNLTLQFQPSGQPVNSTAWISVAAIYDDRTVNSIGGTPVSMPGQPLTQQQSSPMTIGGGGGTTYDHYISISVTHPFIISGAPAGGVVARTNLGSTGSYDCGAVQFAIPGYWTISNTNNSNTIYLEGFDASSNRTYGSCVTLGSNLQIVSNTALPATDAYVDSWLSPSIFFNPTSIGGTITSVYYRVQGSLGWNSCPSNALGSISFGPSVASLSRGQNYEFLVLTAGGESYGSFYLDSNGIPQLANSGMLQKVTEGNRNITFNTTPLPGTTGSSYKMVLTLNNSVTKSVVASSTSFTFTESDLGVSVDNYHNQTLTYSYRLYAEQPGLPGQTIDQYVGQGAGTFRIGSDCWAQAAAQPGDAGYVTPDYQPVARLTIPSNDYASAGSFTITPPGGGAPVSISMSDWRVKATTANGQTTLSIDLSQWFNPSSSTTNLAFSYVCGLDTYTATLGVQTNGATSVSGFQCMRAQRSITLSLPGATSLQLQYSDPGASSMHQVTGGVSGSSPSWTWDVSALAVTTNRTFTYVGTDANGKVVAQGQGSFHLDANGNLVYTWSVQPQFWFQPPAGTASFVVTPTGGGSPLPLTLLSDGSYLFAPPAGYTSGSYSYVAKNSDGTVIGNGTMNLSVDASGVTHQSNTVGYLPVRFQGPIGLHDDSMQMKLVLAPQANATKSGTVMLQGVWNQNLNCMVFDWYAADQGYQDASGAHTYNYTMTLGTVPAGGNFTPLTNVYGQTIGLSGVMTLGASAEQPPEILQTIQELNRSATVSHYQTFNAFGEISEEYDDSTADRAAHVVALYGGTQDPNALKTNFAYNALGKLITKTDPQTNVTLINGYRQRATPITQYGYDLAGRLVTSTDANGYTTREGYVGGGELEGEQWAPDGGWKKTDYDVFGSQRRQTVAIDSTHTEVTTQVVDKMGDVIEVDQLGIDRATANQTLTDTYTYDGFGHRVSHKNAAGWTDETFYDSLGRVVKTVSDQGLVSGWATTYTYTFVATGAAAGGYTIKTSNPDGSSLTDQKDYFGRLVAHTDEGGNAYTYTYDVGGHLALQTSVDVNQHAQQHIQYVYSNNGDIQEVLDSGTHTISQYGYDNAGNRIYEAYGTLGADNQTPSLLYQALNIGYDELNRILNVADTMQAVNVEYEYDAVGNRRFEEATYLDPMNAVRQRDDFWYTYDKANRFLITKGSITHRGNSATDSTGQIIQGAQGVVVSYDLRGDRMTASDASDSTHGELQRYSYTTDGYLQDVYLTPQGGAEFQASHRTLDVLGRTTDYLTYNNDSGHTVAKEEKSTYDEDNHLVSQTDVDSTGTTSLLYKYYRAWTDSETGLTQSVAATAPGALAQVVTTPPSGQGSPTTQTYTYVYYDSALQKSITVTGGGSSGTGTSTLLYNANGYLYRDLKSDGTTIYYNTTANGLVVERQQYKSSPSKPDDVYYAYYADNRCIGDVTVSATPPAVRESYAQQWAQTTSNGKVDSSEYKNQTPIMSADFDQNYQPINEQYPAATPTTYTVRTGDTLRSIAQSMWGDADMWYLIAQANNLSGNETLIAGQVLLIPNKVANIHNNANTFRPYEPGVAIGHIDPTLPPPPPPPPHGGCGTLGVVLMVVVAVVVTIYTAGAAAELMAGESLGSFGATMGAGAGVLGGAGGLSLGTVAAAAVGGAAGSIASQLVGKQLGVVDHFSWKAVGQAALGAAVTAGVGEAMNAASPALTALEKGSDYAKYAIAAGQAATATAVTDVLHGHWSWREIAASAVGAAAGQSAGKAVGAATSGLGAEVSDFARKLGAGFGSAWAQNQVMATDPNYTRARADSMFISSLGSAIGDTIAEPATEDPQEAFRRSEINDENRPITVDPETIREDNRFASWAQQNAEDQAQQDREANRFDSWAAENSLANDLPPLDNTPLPKDADGKWILPSGRHVSDGSGLVPNDQRRVLYNGENGPVYAGDGGQAIRGLTRDTRYAVPGVPQWARPSDGSPLMYTFDSTGQAFWRDSTGTVMSIPAPYAQPTLAGLQGSALWSGIEQGVRNAPGGFVDGVSNLFHGRVTFDSFLTGMYENSPLGVLGAMADDNYQAAGGRLVGTGVSLATGAAFEYGVLPLAGRAVGGAKNYIYSLAPDVSGNPFLADQALSIGSPNPLIWDQRNVFSGHGSVNGATMVVPPGSRITFYAEPGATISNVLGNAIEEGAPMRDVVYRATFGPGEVIPDAVLSPIENSWVSGDVKGTLIRVNERTPLSQLLKENMGDCHWAACMSDPSLPSYQYLYTTEGPVKVR